MPRRRRSIIEEHEALYWRWRYELLCNEREHCFIVYRYAARAKGNTFEYTLDIND